ncbi:MAG TPA: vitamin K epoxide reductase family protein [Candidatus Paceibacterota bacterium]|nr:vitamin K epoxide reductase family protein [Candidatus Paceibacterota bacterium]
MAKNERLFGAASAILSFIGFLDAAYLTAKHYIGGALPCLITSGCDTVTTSAYSALFGIPIALFGALYYLSVFIAAIVLLDSGSRFARYYIFLATPFGFLVSLWLIYLQAFVLNAFCSYCLLSAATSTLLFILSLLWRRNLARK